MAPCTMANQNYTIKRTYDQNIGTRTTLYHSDTSTASPKVSGKLQLRSNPHTWRHTRQELYLYDPNFEFRGAVTDAANGLVYLPDDPLANRLANEAIARFTGKVRKHNASLGVTLGSAKQSLDMIADRSNKIASIFERSLRKWERKKPSGAQKRRTVAKDTASSFLEGEFGWIPLAADIKDAFGALGRDFGEARWVSATAKSAYSKGHTQTGWPNAYDWVYNDSGEISVNVGAKVAVDNPNAWLLNRLGLLNLPGVAWDLIPWSFVVNMVTNMGQMVNSITDFVGMTLSNGCSTRVSSITRQDHRFAGNAPGQFITQGFALSRVHDKQRIRTTGGIPTPSFQWRCPQLNTELALIASSLLVQKMGALNRFFGMNPNYRP